MAATVADEAFERLYTRYGREVYRYALALLRNPADAEDVTQTTFLNAYRALRAGERPRRPHNWLIAIAHNACRSRVRVRMRRPKEVPLDEVVEQLAVPETERPNIRELTRVIGRLPFNQRAAITMRELEGRSYVDIAERLGVTVPAAEALIGRARRTLRARASAFRGLLLMPFRKLVESGDAAGGALGAAGGAKIAALLVVGAVGGGIGIAAGSGGSPSVQAEQPPAARLAAVEVQRPKAMPATAGSHSARTRPTIRPGAETTARAVGSTAPVAAPEPALTTAPAEVSSAAGPTATTQAEPVRSLVTTVVSAVPTVTAPPVSTPPATTPPVSAPAVTTPTVTTPVATVPSVTVPPVTVPSVTVPPLP
jgi:RNA polymerase sigma factor (sigma-70 family)